MKCCSASVAVVLTLALASAASAQPQAPPRFEVSASLLATSPTDLGARAAMLTGNDPGDPGFTLFATATKIGAGAGPELRLGVSLSRRCSVDGALSWSHQTLQTRISGDTELAGNQVITESVATIMAGADAVVSAGMRLAGSRVRPFAFAGGGYVRRADAQAVQSSGPYFDAGAGLKYRLTSRTAGSPASVSLRIDGRIVVRSDRIDPADAAHTHLGVALAVGLSVGL